MQCLVLASAFLVGHALADTRSLYVGLGLGLAVSSLIAVLQAIGLHPVITGEGPDPGLFVNSTIPGEICAAVFVGLMGERLYWIAALLVPALVLCQCRSAALAIAICGTWYAIRRWRWKALPILPVAAAALFVLDPRKWLDSPGVHYRWLIWRDTINGLSFWGRGVGSFYSTYVRYATRLDTVAYQPAHAHNDLLELVFELGVPAAILALVIVGLLFAKAADKERMVLLAIAVAAMFGFPLHTPSTVFLFGVVAGIAARNWPVLGDRQFHWRLGLYPRRQLADHVVLGPRRFGVPLQSRLQAWASAFDHP
jgi:O-antigen ligase